MGPAQKLARKLAQKLLPAELELTRDSEATFNKKNNYWVCIVWEKTGPAPNAWEEFAEAFGVTRMEAIAQANQIINAFKDMSGSASK